MLDSETSGDQTTIQVPNFLRSMKPTGPLAMETVPLDWLPTKGKDSNLLKP